MLAIVKYVVMKPRKRSAVAMRGLKCYHPSVKWIRSPSTELWLILDVYIMSPWDFYLQPISPGIGSRDRELVLNICAYFKVYKHFRF